MATAAPSRSSEPALVDPAPAPTPTSSVSSTGTTLVDLLRDAGTRYGNRPALLIKPGFRTRIWTYRDLADLAPRVARVLADQGLARGDRVLIWGVNRPEWSIGFFGALFAGLVLVPLDVRSQPEFVEKIARRTRAKLVLASTQTAALAAALGLPLVLIESLPDRARDAAPLQDSQAPQAPRQCPSTSLSWQANRPPSPSSLTNATGRSLRSHPSLPGCTIAQPCAFSR